MGTLKYQCAKCRKNFVSNQDDSDALREHAENFPADQIENASIVCEACYTKMSVSWEPN